MTIPKNLLFSCANEIAKSDDEERNKENRKKFEHFSWSSVIASRESSVMQSHASQQDLAERIQSKRSHNSNTPRGLVHWMNAVMNASNIISKSRPNFDAPKNWNESPKSDKDSSYSASKSTVAAASELLDRKYQCKICPQIFGGKTELQMHNQQHMRETKPYKCTQCTKSFANSSYLSQHTRIHLGIKPYRCEICQRKFTQLSHLQQHIRTHTGDKPYKCRHVGCVKMFSQLSNLQSHSRCHATDKPYKCNSCYKCFNDETALLEHIPKHKESKHLKTHICQYCGKSYTQETYLAKHLQKHLERAEKRATGLGLTAARNVAINNTTTIEHPYWPKVSPDSAENMQQQNQYDFVLNQQQQNNTNEHIQGHHRTVLDHHRNNGSNGNSNGNDDVVEDLVVIRQNPTVQHLVVTASQPQSNQQQHATSAASAGTIVVTTSSAYDTASKVSTNSAFTPINVMPTHLNTLQHHQLAQRPLYYDAIAFQNKNVPQNTTNGFSNQLISLHQIRNYAHQPGGLMAGEHLLGIGVSAGIGKDKGQ